MTGYLYSQFHHRVRSVADHFRASTCTEWGVNRDIAPLENPGQGRARIPQNQYSAKFATQMAEKRVTKPYVNDATTKSAALSIHDIARL